MRNLGTAIAIFLLLVAPRGAASSQHTVAFAGGFGPKSLPATGKGGRDNNNNKRKRKGLSEFQVLQPPKTVLPDLTGTSTGTGTGTKSEADNKDAPKLDKWGLPVLSPDDFFPPLPSGTELISAPADPDQVSQSLLLQRIRDSLANHITLDLQRRFGPDGIEKYPSPGRKAMQLRLLHSSPPVLAIENFLSDLECQEIKDVTNPTVSSSSSSSPTTTINRRDDNNNNNQQNFAASALQVNSATLSTLATSIRTSTSWFCHYAQVPTLLAKARHVLGIPLPQMEEPQVVRYRPGEEFSWHYDELPTSLLENGGQRVATLLVYLNHVEKGGGTMFRDLKGAGGGSRLTVTPRMGSALLFFPAFADGTPDDRTLHKGEVATDTKWICQMWIHQHAYTPATPPGNSHSAALGDMERVSNMLGYTCTTDHQS